MNVPESSADKSAVVSIYKHDNFSNMSVTTIAVNVTPRYISEDIAPATTPVIASSVDEEKVSSPNTSYKIKPCRSYSLPITKSDGVPTNDFFRRSDDTNDVVVCQPRRNYKSMIKQKSPVYVCRTESNSSHPKFEREDEFFDPQQPGFYRRRMSM